MRLGYLLEALCAYVLYYSGIYWLRRKSLEKRGAAVVLVYHRVLRGKHTTGQMVGEEALEWQLRYIRGHFQPVGWESILSPARALPGIRVLVTFDDGYRDNFTRALPVIEKFRIPAVFFATTNLIFDRKAIRDNGRDLDGDIFPTSDELRRAKESPYITYGNHTASHGILSRVKREAFETELSESQRKFQEQLGVTPNVFAFPRGRKGDVTQAVFPALEKNNIHAAFTMIPGLVDSKTHRYLIPRIGMSHVNDKVLFKVKMLGLLNPLISLKNRLTS
jgi:peptidoglycan/xylan/chitin deacetylase (PgdA/CDA1 family)